MGWIQFLFSCQHAIRHLCPDWRKISSYARPRPAPTKSLEREVICWSHHSWLDISSLYRHGTLEFRSPEGTLNAADLVGWALFFKALVKLAMSGRKPFYADKPEHAQAILIALVVLLCGNKRKTQEQKMLRAWILDRHLRIHGKHL
jgi:hypothetical protein